MTKPDEHTLEQREAAQALTALDSELWYDLGPKLTCVEADAISEFLTAWGAPDDAASLMRSHSDCDDEGDAHFTGDRAADDDPGFDRSDRVPVDRVQS